MPPKSPGLIGRGYTSLELVVSELFGRIRDPPANVYKGSSMSAETEEYLRLNGLKNALYSIRAADLKEDLFGQLVPCTFQQPSFFEAESDIPSSSAQKIFGAGNVESIGTTSVSCDLSHAKVEAINAEIAGLKESSEEFDSFIIDCVALEEKCSSQSEQFCRLHQQLGEMKIQQEMMINDEKAEMLNRLNDLQLELEMIKGEYVET